MSVYSPAGVQFTGMPRQATLAPVLVDAWLPRAAAQHPDRPAVNRLTYAQLLGEAARAARHLAARGVAAGDRVGLELPPGEAFVIALHAILLLGAVAVPIDTRLGPDRRLAVGRGGGAGTTPSRAPAMSRPSSTARSTARPRATSTCARTTISTPSRSSSRRADRAAHRSRSS